MLNYLLIFGSEHCVAKFQQNSDQQVITKHGWIEHLKRSFFKCSLTLNIAGKISSQLNYSVYVAEDVRRLIAPSACMGEYCVMYPLNAYRNIASEGTLEEPRRQNHTDRITLTKSHRQQHRQHPAGIIVAGSIVAGSIVVGSIVAGSPRHIITVSR